MPSRPRETNSGSPAEVASGLRQDSPTLTLVPSPFRLNPESFGGRSARKGFEFQDQYIAYVLSGLLSERKPQYCRIEAVEDLDVLIQRDGELYERYYQMKSVEGSSGWTVKSLARHGGLQQILH